MYAIWILNIRSLLKRPFRTMGTLVSAAAGSALVICVLEVAISVSGSTLGIGILSSKFLPGSFGNLVENYPITVLGNLGNSGLSPSSDALVMRAAERGGINLGRGVPIEAVTAVSTASLSTRKASTASLSAKKLSTAMPQTSKGRLQGDVNDPGSSGRRANSNRTIGALVIGISPLPGEALFVSPSLTSHRGESVSLNTAQGPIPIPANLQSSTGPIRLAGNTVIMPLARAQLLFSRGTRYDELLIPAPTNMPTIAAIRRLSSELGPNYTVQPTGTPPAVVGIIADSYLPLLSLIAIVAAGISIALVANTARLIFEERRRSIAIAAATGASPGFLAGAALVEFGIIGAFGGALGALAGHLLAQPVISILGGFVESLSGTPISVQEPWGLWLMGVLAGGAISLAGVALSLRSVSRQDVASELSGREAKSANRGGRPIWAILSVTFLVLSLWVVAHYSQGGATSPGSYSIARISLVAATIFSLLVVGTVSPLVAQAVYAAPRGFGWVSTLATASLWRQAARTGIMVVGVSAVVSISVMTASTRLSQKLGIESSFKSSDPAHTLIIWSGDGGGSYTDEAAIPRQLMNGLPSISGVRSINPSYYRLVGSSAKSLAFVETDNTENPAFRVASGSYSRERIDEGWAMIGTAYARRTGAHPGSWITLPTIIGNMRLRVCGIWYDGNFNGDSVTVSPLKFLSMFGLVPPREIEITLRPGANAVTVYHAITSIGSPGELKVLTADQQLSREIRNASALLKPFDLLQASLLLVTFISVASLLVLSQMQRQRELGALVAIGAGPGKLMLLVLAEAAFVTFVGIAFGLGTGASGSWAIGHLTPAVNGYYNPPAIDLSAALAQVPLLVVVGLAAALLPVLKVSRLDPAGMLSNE